MRTQPPWCALRREATVEPHRGVVAAAFLPCCLPQPPWGLAQCSLGRPTAGSTLLGFPCSKTHWPCWEEEDAVEGPRLSPADPGPPAAPSCSAAAAAAAAAAQSFLWAFQWAFWHSLLQ